jgi:hypothetical protein
MQPRRLLLMPPPLLPKSLNPLLAAKKATFGWLFFGFGKPNAKTALNAL